MTIFIVCWTGNYSQLKLNCLKDMLQYNMLWIIFYVMSIIIIIAFLLKLFHVVSCCLLLYVLSICFTRHTWREHVYIIIIFYGPYFLLINRFGLTQKKCILRILRLFFLLVGANPTAEFSKCVPVKMENCSSHLLKDIAKQTSLFVDETEAFLYCKFCHKDYVHYTAFLRTK